ncbi:hypothetical protein D1872_329990 [compost metagenome]
MTVLIKSYRKAGFLALMLWLKIKPATDGDLMMPQPGAEEYARRFVQQRVAIADER